MATNTTIGASLTGIGIVVLLCGRIFKNTTGDAELLSWFVGGSLVAGGICGMILGSGNQQQQTAPINL